MKVSKNAAVKNNSLIFQLYSNCISVKGARRSIICDLQNGEYWHIPNKLHDIINDFDGMTVSEIKTHYKELFNSEIDEFLSFLVNLQVGHFVTLEDFKNKKSISFEYESPSVIDNAILDYDLYSDYELFEAMSQMDSLGVKYIQLRFYFCFSLFKLEQLLNKIRNLNFHALEILIKYDITLDEEKYLYLTQEFARIKNLIIHSCPFDDVIYSKNKTNMGNLLFLKQSILDETHCGKISPNSFRCSINFVSESKSFNNCLNKKISVAADGSIKNCPSMKDDFGNIREVKLIEILKNRNFLNMFSLKKDDISVCKTCEYRYICSDCRAYTVGSTETKPSKCNYNPETGSWG